MFYAEKFTEKHSRSETNFSEKENLEAYAMKRVAAGGHLQTPRVFEPAKRPDDGRADYCLDCSFLP